MKQRETPAAPRAEVEEIWPRDGSIRILGRLTGGVPDGGGTALVLRVRGREEELRFPAALDASGTEDGGEDSREDSAEGGAADVGPRFDARIPLTELAAATAGREETWDLYLSCGGAGGAHGADRPYGAPPEPLRLGRHLDDVRGKKHIFVYPSQTAAGLRIEPFYTIRDNVSVRCARAEEVA